MLKKWWSDQMNRDIAMWTAIIILAWPAFYILCGGH